MQTDDAPTNSNTVRDGTRAPVAVRFPHRTGSCRLMPSRPKEASSLTVSTERPCVYSPPQNIPYDGDRAAVVQERGGERRQAPEGGRKQNARVEADGEFEAR